ncbi:MAG: Gfo/Idh/MocA family oxidoreductase, partial [Gaiellales bacterium]
NVVAVNLSFGDVACHLSWVDLPGIARYSQEFAFYSPDRRATLRFPSPFLPNMPTELALEGGVSGTSRAWLTSETASYEEAFKRELIELHAAITGDRDPLTSGDDGLRDLQLGAAIVRAHLERRPIDDPVSPEHAEALRSP